MHIDKLKNLIQSTHINFLFGSGLSCPYLTTLTNIEIWLTESNKIADETLRYLIQDNLFIKYVEDVMKHCLLQYRTNKDSLTIVENAYENFLSIWNYVMSRRSSNLLNKQVNIFTTNIDPFVEEAAERLRIEFNNGFKGLLTPVLREESFSTIMAKVSPLYQNQSQIPVFNYLKIHGSINWMTTEDNEITYDSQLNCLNTIVQAIENYPKDYRCVELAEEELEKENEGKDEESKEALSFKLIEDKAKQCIEKGKFEVTDKMQAFREAYSKLVMVNPRKTKFQETVLDLHFYELLRLYSNALEKASTSLFVAGFSFADEHIAQITIRAAVANPTLQIVIFAYSENSKKDIATSLNKAGYTSNNNILILSPKDYKKSQDKQFIESFQSPDDFNKLERFDLKSINQYVFEPIKRGLF